MKKRTLTYLGMVLLNVLFAAQMFAQTTVNMPFNTGPTSFTIAPPATCFFNFFDNGGAAGNYSNSSSPVTSIVTFCPSSAASVISVTFSSFATEGTFDALYIYNGNVAETNAAGPNASISVGTLVQANQFNSGSAVGATFRAGGFQGGTSPGTRTASAASGCLTFQFDSDTSVTPAGWAAVVAQVPRVACVMTAPANITTGNSPATACAANVTTAAPSFAPAACNAAFSLQYRVNGGAPVVIGAVVPATVTILGVPVGVNTIRWELVDPCGNIVVSSVTQTITVNDTTPPTITCPADIVINLDAGECSAFVNYNVTLTDNCPLVENIIITQNPPSLNPAQAVNAAQSLNCGFTQTKFGRVFNTAVDLTITGLQVGQRTNGGGAYTYNVYVLTSGTAPAAGNANMALVFGPLNINMPNIGTGYASVPFPTQVVIPAGSNYFVEIIDQDGNFTMGNILAADLPGTPSYIAANACGLPNYGTFASVGFAGLSLAFNVVGLVAADPVTQTSGLPSGSEFFVGTTENCFTGFDVAGNQASCCFDVVIKEYANPSQQMACNDQVQISLDQECVAEVGADDILEGGLYGCYDTRYTVMIITPMGGLVSPAVVGPCDIGDGPITVKVVDNVTGQSCWGSVIVEDKLPPVIECRDVTIPCTQDLADLTQPAPAIQGPQSIILENIGDIIESGAGTSPREYEFDFGYIPAGIPVLDANVRIKLTGHTWLPDLEVILEAPDGAQASVLTIGGCIGQEWPIDATFDDEGIVITQCAQLNAGGAALQGMVQGVSNNTLLAAMDGKDANGTWKVIITDDFAGDDGVIETVGVILDVNAPLILPSDNCGNVPLACHAEPTVTYVDSYVDGGTCDAGSVTRVWTATDFSGNHASCTQHITIERPVLDDVVPPADVMWTCEQYNAFPNITGATALHPFITDTDLSTAVINVNLDPNCDDLDLNLGTPVTQDNPGINATNVANGGLGCPGSNPFFGNNGLDDADVLAITGSGLPTFDGFALNASCEISWDYDDLVINECAGTFKILRSWTLIDWCANPYRVVKFDQIIKVVDNKAPVLELFAVAGQNTSNYGTHDIPALGNGSNGSGPGVIVGNVGGGCNQEPQLSGGTSFRALVQLPQSLTPEQFTNVRLERLWLEVDHARLSDLDIFLRSPDNRILQITANNGGNGTSMDADFYDAAPGNVNEAQFNIIGDFKPEGHNAVQYSYANIFGQGFAPNYDVEWTVSINGVPQVFNFTLTAANPMNQLAQLMNNNDPAAGIAPYVPNWVNNAAAGNTNTNLFFISGGYSGNGVQYGPIRVLSHQNHQWYTIFPTPHGASCGGFVPTITTFAQFDNPNLGFQGDMLGTWELLVFDEVAGATGKVVNWKLFFSTGPLTIDVYNASTPQNAGPHAVCAGSVVVPPVDGYDNCSGIHHYTSELWTIVPGSNPALPMTLVASLAGNGGVFNNVPLFLNGANARYIVRHYATDGCGNQTFVDRVIQLRDKVPPTPICVEYSEISITNNSNQTGGSCSRLYAENLDLASYDNCKPVYFLMAKMSAATSPNIFNRCYYPYRDFCCSDIGNQQVILLVLDTDPTPLFTTQNNASLGCDGTPGLFLSSNFQFNTSSLNFSTCMVDVQVTDKIHPVLVSCPPNQRISCDWYADNLETQLASLTTPAQRSALLTSLGFGAPTYYDNCSIDLQVTFSTSLDQCLEGTITRSWNNTRDAAGNVALQPCTQTINVDHVSDFAVEFPADVTINCGANVPDFGEPEIFYETCELVAVTSDDVTYNVVADACYKIVRTWTVINWCVVGAEIDQEVVEQPENQLGLAFPACDIDNDGDCDARTFRDSWRGSVPTPNPFAPTAYRLRPFVNDAHTPNTNPVLNFRNPDTDIDTDPWDGYITYQQVIKVQDNVDPVFTNGCVIPDVCIEDNSCSATILLPEPEITECSDHYTVTAQVLIGGVWLNGFSPILGVAPGTYQVRYVAQDNCNNQTQCLSTVTVKDCKKPTPYCKNGVIIEIMQTGMVEVWASDLDAGSFDNCPPTQDPKLSFSANVADISNLYTCDDLGTQEVELWVTDAAGNQDFCTTFVVIQDNMDVCTDDPRVEGTIANENDLGVEGVNVNVNSPQGFDANATTNAAGIYGVAVPLNSDVTVTPVYDENPLNGVSTFDLVLISKHILGVTPLGSPYKVIAADANRSNSVTTFDLVEIRKLILFINSDFPNNTSWRFVDAAYSFPNASNPFAAAFPEVINLNDVAGQMVGNDFVAVKIGDVNGSAAVNLLGTAGERSMVGDLVLNADDVNVEAGKEYTVEFKATDFNVSGYQFSLNFNNKALEFVSVAAGVADASNFGTTMVGEGVITASWNNDEVKRLATGEVVFGLTFKAVQSGRMSELMNINSSYTVAEAYNSGNELLNVALSFNNNLVTGAFDLYQNTPNPFASVTTIGFYLPEATSATLTISDVQGKVVKVIKGDYSKGYNTVNLNRSDVGAAGVLSYRLDTDSDSATRKMILVD
jgi:subtilisin-like proprotein convertase family protein